MIPQRISTVNDSTKRESFLAIGKARVRVPGNFHARLTRFCQRRCYSRAFDALIYAASIGLNVLEAAEEVTVIKVNDCDRE